MLQAHRVPTSASQYRSTFDSALKAYEVKTGKVLSSDPLLRRLATCRSPDDIITLLRQQIPEVDQSLTGDGGLTRWLNPTVNVINAFAAAIGGIVDPVSPPSPSGTSGIWMLISTLQAYSPAGLIFTAIGILFSVSIFIISFEPRFCNGLISQTATAESTTRGALELFERIEIIFMRLEIYIKLPETARMTDVIAKVLVDFLDIIAIATKEINENRASKFIPGDV
jgi:hypothetical protein